jgi:hypothetical protein
VFNCKIIYLLNFERSKFGPKFFKLTTKSLNKENFVCCHYIFGILRRSGRSPIERARKNTLAIQYGKLVMHQTAGALLTKQKEEQKKFENFFVSTLVDSRRGAPDEAMPSRRAGIPALARETIPLPVLATVSLS